MPPLAYRPDIDGLRAIAVVAVVLFHAEFLYTPGGFAGVDVFFVISGYLISSIIARAIEAGDFSFAWFYERRIRRILPALVVVYAFCTAVAYALFLPTEFHTFGESLAASAAFVSNVLFYGEAGYFDAPSHVKPLLHTWSLSVEEQFYLLWPPLVALVLYQLRPNWRLAAIIGIAVLSLGWSEFLARSNPSAAFLMTQSRIWELMLGALLAFAPAYRLAPALAETLSVLGLALVLGSMALLNSTSAFPGLLALAPCLGTAALIASGQSGSVVKRALSLKPIVFVGLISYSLYLWHWPLLSFGRYFFDRSLEPLEASGLIAASFAIAVASWRWIEMPARRAAIPRPRILWVGGVGIGLLLAVGVFANRGILFPDQITDARLAAIEAYARERSPLRATCNTRDGTLVLGDRCMFGARKPQPDIVMIGDSHADQFVPALLKVAEAGSLSGRQITTNGCAPLTGVHQVRDNIYVAHCDSFRTGLTHYIGQLGKPTLIVLAARWAIYSETTIIDENRRIFLIGSSNESRTVESSRRLLREGLERTVDMLTNAGHRVLLIGQIPDYQQSRLQCYLRQGANDPASCGMRAADAHSRLGFSSALLKTMAERPGVKTVLPEDILCGGARCLVALNGVYLYLDTDHLNRRGAEQFAPVLSAALNELAAQAAMPR